jgi:Rod binding domain-containing protein
MSNGISPLSAPQGPGSVRTLERSERADASKAAAHDPRVEKLRHAATEFESILVKQLLKAAKIGGAGAEKANGYADMAVDALASGIEGGGGLGLARRIEEAIGARTLERSERADPNAGVSHPATPVVGVPPSNERGR